MLSARHNKIKMAVEYMSYQVGFAYTAPANYRYHFRCS